MNAVKEWIDAFTDLEDNLNDIIIQVLKDHEVQILKLNKDQLFEGLSGYGQRINPQYAKSTVRIKKKKGQPYNRVTLKDEGDYYDSIEIVFENDKLIFGAGDFKHQFLLKRYGPDILGLNEASRKKVVTMIRNPLIFAVRSKLNLL